MLSREAPAFEDLPSETCTAYARTAMCRRHLVFDTKLRGSSRHSQNFWIVRCGQDAGAT